MASFEEAVLVKVNKQYRASLEEAALVEMNKQYISFVREKRKQLLKIIICY